MKKPNNQIPTPTNGYVIIDVEEETVKTKGGFDIVKEKGQAIDPIATSGTVIAVNTFGYEEGMIPGTNKNELLRKLLGKNVYVNKFDVHQLITPTKRLYAVKVNQIIAIDE